MTLPHRHRFVIGDWSNDGHNRKEFFYFLATHGRDDIIAAYKRAVAQIGISLHTNSGEKISLLTEYEDYFIQKEHQETLPRAGIDLGKLSGIPDMPGGSIFCQPQDALILFLEFVKTQLAGFSYEIEVEPRPINGFWQEDFNFGFGYGTF